MRKISVCSSRVVQGHCWHTQQILLYVQYLSYASSNGTMVIVGPTMSCFIYCSTASSQVGKATAYTLGAVSVKDSSTEWACTYHLILFTTVSWYSWLVVKSNKFSNQPRPAVLAQQRTSPSLDSKRVHSTIFLITTGVAHKQTRSWSPCQTVSSSNIVLY